MHRFWIRQRIFILWVIAGVLFLIACGKDDGRQAAETVSGIRKTFEKGPVQVFLETDKLEITIAERLALSLTVLADENADIGWPSMDRNINQFRVIDVQTTQPELVDHNRKKVVRTYVMEPFLAGEYIIPPLKMTFRKTGAGNEIITVETGELTIPVKSVLPDAQPKHTPHDIKPPMDIPGILPYWIWIIIGGILLALVIFAVFLRKKKTGSMNREEVRLSAHEIAFRELENLAVPIQMDRAEIKLFYQKISDILRRYIENRFGVNAPEQTTEEFLAGMDSQNVIATVHKPLLRSFLAQCDLVKFAEHNPGKEDIDESFDRCRYFIDQTKTEPNG
ncbi:MAG: DUF4381 family protein [Desulfobacteraceae bacterium]|nr:MAG: DUF4381 family protein [Desulfobacteraceae bacterium]